MTSPFDALAQFAQPAATRPETDVVLPAKTGFSSTEHDPETQAKLDSGDYNLVNGRLLPRTKVWLNPKVTLKGTDSEGREIDISVSLPKGMPIDTMAPMVIKPTDSPAYRQKAEANNYFRKLIADAGLSLEPGSSKTIMLECEISRVNDTTVEASKPGENSLMTQLDGMFGKQDK